MIEIELLDFPPPRDPDEWFFFGEGLGDPMVWTKHNQLCSSKLVILHLMNLISRKDPKPRKKATKKQIQEIQVHV